MNGKVGIFDGLPKRINHYFAERRTLFKEKRTAITRTMSIVLIVVLVGAVAAGEYVLSNSKNPNQPTEVDLHIIEDNPVLQIDHFYPDTLYVSLGENVSLAIQNGDDETRVFTLSEFNINVTMSAGTAQRVTLQANKLGNFTFISPVTPPSAVSQGRPGKCLEGFFIVTQNATLLSSTTSASGVGAPGSTYCLTTASG